MCLVKIGKKLREKKNGKSFRFGQLIQLKVYESFFKCFFSNVPFFDGFQRMTAHEGYVWFLPSWYAKHWWDVDYYNNPPSPGDSYEQEHIPCTTEDMEYAVNGHFILQKTFSDPDNTRVVGGITVKQYKDLYKFRVGRAVSSISH